MTDDWWADDWWFDKPEPRAWRTHFIFLKTRFAIEFAYEAIEALQQSWPYRTWLLWMGADELWEDGFVLRIKALKDAIALAEEHKEALDKFEAWAIHDDAGVRVESQPNGPLSRFFDIPRQVGTQGANFSQIFLMWPEGSQEPTKTIEDIRSCLKAPHAPVFFFRNGQIILLGSDESGKITNQRCARYLSRLSGWCVVDSSRETFSPKGPDERRWGTDAFFNLLSND